MNNQDTIRTFIAIPIPENISLFLKKIQGEMRENRVNASWTRPSTLHLTLRFIGDTQNARVPRIHHAMKATAAAFAPFCLSAGGVGVFPGLRKPRVIWSGVKGQVDQLEKVQAFLEKNLEQAGIAAATRSFSPHFTLGRLKDRGAALGKCIQQFESYGSKSCLIKSMKLFKSDLMPKGAVHTVLFEAGFGKMGQGLNLFAAQKET